MFLCTLLLIDFSEVDILTQNFDSLFSDGIKSFILPEFLPASVDVYDTVSSTNTLMKQEGHSLPHGSITVASHQSLGRGRLGRAFFSPSASGIYMSILLKPSFSVSETPLITTCAAVSVCEAIESLSEVKPKIKWVNDIFVNDKKVCGILTESVFSPDGNLDFCVLGIGINVYPPECGFPDDILSIAGHVFNKSEESLKNRLVAAVYNSFMQHYKTITSRSYIEEYKKRCFILGKRINVISHTSSSPVSALALDIDNDCRLLVKYDDSSTQYLSTGEIIIRL